MAMEMGKPIAAGKAEVEKSAGACDYFAENAASFLARQQIQSDASRSYVRFDPLGPVLAIMPWNFPFWQVIRFAAPALMAGNVALLKHAANVPECALAIERIFAEAQFPPGVFSTLLIEDNLAAEKLIDHPASSRCDPHRQRAGGKGGVGGGGASVKKTVMELGGSDPFIVLADADVRTVAGLAAERALHQQRPKLHRRQAVHRRARNRRGVCSGDDRGDGGDESGDPLDGATRVGPLARLDLLETLHGQVQRSVEQGAIAAWRQPSARPGVLL